MYQTLIFEIENGICIITINRSDKLNALNRDVFNELGENGSTAIHRVGLLQR